MRLWRVLPRQLIYSLPLLDLTQNYFALFGLRPNFHVDVDSLTLRYREIQSTIHPDRFVGKGEQAQRMAVQSASFVNEAYQCLKTPLCRAEYLLRLQGIETQQEERTHHDTEFLLEQMELRERLEAFTRQADPWQAFDLFLTNVEKRTEQMQESFGKAFEAGDNAGAVDSVLKWKFLVKLRADAERLRDHLEQD